MSYSPKNLSIFTAAFSGALAGMGGSGRVPSSAVSSGYAGLASIAGAWAQAYDTAWGTGAASVLDTTSTRDLSYSAWADRAPLAVAPFTTPATWTAECNALIAIVQAGETYFTGLGITQAPGSNIVHLKLVVPSLAAVNPYVIATAMSIILPDNAKAHGYDTTSKQGGWIRTGSAGIGGLSNVATANTAPATTTMMVAPNGDLLFNNATDAPTLVDAYYEAENQNVVSGNFVCTPGTGVVAGLPTGIVSILEAEVLVGGVTGKCIVNIPAAAAPATGLANLDLAKAGVFFCIADAATSVRLKLGVAN